MCLRPRRRAGHSSRRRSGLGRPARPLRPDRRRLTGPSSRRQGRLGLVLLSPGIPRRRRTGPSSRRRGRSYPLPLFSPPPRRTPGDPLRLATLSRRSAGSRLLSHGLLLLLLSLRRLSPLLGRAVGGGAGGGATDRPRVTGPDSNDVRTRSIYS
ncbi:MAG: hypothetical protein ACK56F_04635, partial [bacterium]